MKQFKIKSESLALGMAKVLKVKVSNHIIPTLENVHAKTIPGGLILTCTNLETTIITGVEADTERNDIEFLIPPPAFAVINYLKQAEKVITITLTKTELSFSYDNNVMKFAPGEVENYPKPAELKKPIEFEIENSYDLFPIFADALTYASTDDMRPAMTGVLFTEKEVAGTDAHRLLRADYKVPTKKKFEAILPKTLINSLPILEPKTKFRIDSDYISVNDGSTQIISRLIDAKFPNYEAVIPKKDDSPSFAIEVNSAELLYNIRLASSFENKNKRVVFEFTDKAYSIKGIDHAFDQEIILHGECCILNPYKIPDFKEHLKISFNGQMLSHSINTASEENFLFWASKPNKAIVCYSGVYTLVIMPLMYDEEAEKAAVEEKNAPAKIQASVKKAAA